MIPQKASAQLGTQSKPRASGDDPALAAIVVPVIQ